jgi:DNA-binding GntR family transcriptional regulator
VTVVGVSPDATVDNFAILAALSGKAAESAATRLSPDELAQLERVAETLEGSEFGDPMIR